MIIHGDCLDVLRGMPDSSVDSVVTDPPYGLKFMGKKWDYDVPKTELWREVLRVLKPGGHALIACGTRTQHRMAVNIEDAGFEIRDVITWLYGSGFPKSLDVSKAIDKAAGAVREVVGTYKYPDGSGDRAVIDSSASSNQFGANRPGGSIDVTAPATEAAKQWQGFGTALKPACEFWTLARKPLEGTVTSNVTKWGVGGINVDGCRVEGGVLESDKRTSKCGVGFWNEGNARAKEQGDDRHNPQGRFPANLILDEEAAALLDEQTGHLDGAGHARAAKRECGATGMFSLAGDGNRFGASRFFYVAKASKSERNAGLSGGQTCTHPTVKPIRLMRYLCRLITPPGGLVLDLFCGSGSTGVAALGQGYDFIGIERELEYVEIAKARIGGK